MNPQLVAQQQRYLQQYQSGQHPPQRPHPQQIHGHAGQHGHPGQHMQHMQHQQHAQQRRQMGPVPPRPRTGQPPVVDHATHLVELQARHERSLTAAKRPTDTTIPATVAPHLVGGEELITNYRRTQDVERRLDAQMMRKLMQIEQEVELEEEGLSINPLAPVPQRQHRTMRVWITNTVDSQPWQGGSSLDEDAFDFSAGGDPRYRVKIVGKIIDADPAEEGAGERGDDDDLDWLDSESESEAEDDAMEEDDTEAVKTESDKPAANGTVKPHAQKPEAEISEILEKLAARAPPLRLSNCFEKITVDVERSGALPSDRDSEPAVTWTRPASWSSEQDFDTLAFERNSDETLHATIKLHRASHGLFQLSPPLAELLQLPEATKPEIVQAMGQYIRLHRLAQDEDKGLVRADEELRKVIGSDVMPLRARLIDALAPHLRPLPPHTLPYTIRTDAAFASAGSPPTIYDIPVPWPLAGPSASPTLARLALRALVHTPTAKRVTGAIAQRDAAQATAVAALQASKARHAFYDSLAGEPHRFVGRWVSSQRRDLEVILGDARFGNPDEGVPEWERWMADAFRRGGAEGVWGSEGVRESVGLMVRQRGL